MEINHLVRMLVLMSVLFLGTACSKASFDGAGATSVADRSSADNSDLELADDGQQPVDIGDDDSDNDSKKDDYAKKDDDDHKDCNKDDDDKKQASNSESDPYVACYLSSNSKWKLGISDGWLSMVNSVSKSVCVPKSVCLNQVGQMFGISVAADRGYCDKNPNVLRISKSQFENL